MHDDGPPDDAARRDDEVDVRVACVAVLPRGEVAEVTPVACAVGREAMLHRHAVRVGEVPAGELAVVAPYVAVCVDVEAVRTRPELLHDRAHQDAALAPAAPLRPPLRRELHDAAHRRTRRRPAQAAHQHRLRDAAQPRADGRQPEGAGGGEREQEEDEEEGEEGGERGGDDGGGVQEGVSLRCGCHGGGGWVGRWLVGFVAWLGGGGGGGRRLGESAAMKGEEHGTVSESQGSGDGGSRLASFIYRAEKQYGLLIIPIYLSINIII